MIRNPTYNEILEDYCEAVLSGEIVACKLVVQAVTKFVDELAKSEKQDCDFPYYFNRDQVEVYCSAFPTLMRHSKGEWAGRQFELLPWQVFIVANIFGWKRRDDHCRRIRKAFVSVGRKNGKTTLCAGLELIMLALDGEAGAEVYIAATKLEQAKLIHDECERMLKQSPYLYKHAVIYKNNIAFPASNSFARPVANDKPFDGLNPSAVFFDELHALKEHYRKFFETMTTAGGSRTQPLQVAITTAGDEHSTIYNEESNYARRVIKGEVHDDKLFAMIFEMDKEDDCFVDDFDLRTMRKANPGLGISLRQEYVADQLREARNKPQAKNAFIRYHANQCVTSVEESISAEKWDCAVGPLSDWKTAAGIAGGFDIGGRDDLAAYALCAKFQIGENDEGVPLYRYEVTSRCFISGSTKRDLSEQPFASWIERGKLQVCEYVIAELETSLIEDCDKYGISYVAYDPHNAARVAEQLEMAGLKPVKMAQSHMHFDETIKDYHQEITENRFKPDEDDDLLRWCALNMCLKRDAAGRMMPDKPHSRDKIDAAVAMLMARRAAALAYTYHGSLAL